MYHNNNPFVLVEYTKRFKRYRGCMSKFDNPKFVIRNEEWASSVQTVNPQASSGGTSGVLSLQSFLHPTASSLLQVSRNYYQSETVNETDC